MDDVKIKVIDSDKLINTINEGSYDVDLSAVMALGAVMSDAKKQEICEYCHSDAERNKWIPCSEKLPEDDERVLATHLGGLNPDRQVIEHIYKNGEFTLGWDMDMNMDSPTFGQRYMGKVVAWMPLPEPYKEGEG